MALKQVVVGTNPNDGTGDSIRDAFIKCNENFSSLDITLGANASFIQLTVTNGISGGIVTSPVYKSTTYTRSDAVISATTTAPITIDSWATVSYRSAKYMVSVTDGTNSAMYEVVLTHNTATVSHTVGVSVVIGTVGSFSSSKSNGNVVLTFTPATATNKTFKITKTLIDL